MINTRELKIAMARCGINQRGLAKMIGRSEAGVSKVINGGKCDIDTAQKIIKALDISDPMPIFFAEELA